jgi:hypothetical protein
VRKLEQPFAAVIDARVKSSKGVSHQARLYTEPIAEVSFWTNWISPIDLAGVVERHYVWIRDERWLMFVLYPDRSPWKHEAMVFGRPRVLKGWVLRAAAKGANSNQVAFEDHSVNLFVYS